jgi:hypothetical protein
MSETRIWASDITARRKELGIEFATNIYLSRERDQIIFAPLFWADKGLFFEQYLPFFSRFDEDDETIGHALKRALMMFQRNVDGFKSISANHWPAFEIAKERTKLAFRSKYVLVTAVTMNASLRLETMKEYDDQIFVGSYVSPGCQDEEIDALLKRLYGAACILRTSLDA